MSFLTRLMDGVKHFLSLPFKTYFSVFLVKIKNAVMLACLGAFVMLTSSSCIRMTRSGGRFPLPRSTSEWVQSQRVQKPADQLKQIKGDIHQKRLESIRNWRAYNEAERRVLYGIHLISLDWTANRSLSDRVCLKGFLEQEEGVRTLCYDSFCVLATQLETLDEREFLLSGDRNMGPVNSNLNGSLQLHRRSQVQGISLNFSHQPDRTVPISGSGNHSSSANQLSAPGEENQLIVPGQEHAFLPPWQDPPGPF